MTVPATPQDAGAVAEFVRHRPRLLGIAYRMMGSMWDAEDIVADAQVRWLTTDHAAVREPVAFLTTMVTRLALDQLRSARAQRESYLGPWLPEPVLTDPSPLEFVAGNDDVSLATLHMMERLTPPERAVFILREVFDLPYVEVAEVLDVLPGHARQLLHRARRRLASELGAAREAQPAGDPARQDPEEHGRLLGLLLDAARHGRLGPLRDQLAEDVVSYNDGGGGGRGALRPIVGADRVADFVLRLGRRFGVGAQVRMVEVNGFPAALFSFGDQEQLAAIDVRDGKIQAIYGVINPDKLRYLRRQLHDFG